jgi:hypothetical protein
MWEPQTLVALGASTAFRGINLPLLLPLKCSIRPTTFINIKVFECYNTGPALSNFVFLQNGKENIKQTFIIPRAYKGSTKFGSNTC